MLLAVRSDYHFMQTQFASGQKAIFEMVLYALILITPESLMRK